MSRAAAVRWAALSWGFATFFAIGVNYAGMALLLLAVLVDRDHHRERMARLRAAPHWWPACLFVAWSAFVLVFGPHYEETASNAAHALRIVLTLALALALDRRELVAALRGFFAALVVSLIIIAANQIITLPSLAFWNGLLKYRSNKALANAILMALAVLALLLLVPRLRPRQRLTALVLLAATLAVLIGVLHSRTAWFIILAGIVAGFAHQVRSLKPRWSMALVAAALAAVAIGFMVPDVRERLILGADQIISAHQGDVVGPYDSWGVRYRMYTETLEMIRERPWAGWGIGGWNVRWQQSTDGPLASINMPHDDFLWMGAQAGVPGVLVLFFLIAAGLPRYWRRRDASGAIATCAVVAMLLATASNSALRDASIGLTVWFIVLVFQAMGREPAEAWHEVFARPGNARVDR